MALATEVTEKMVLLAPYDQISASSLTPRYEDEEEEYVDDDCRTP